ncbi:SIR2 family histone deacetylase-like protein [Emericellopsis cladophorae]|uniref:SIR2 family histone deacetylase-like protein n=1 Tax=Emericellopsis cladophorae TaxID=2686198 RepID=A0A9P9XXK2_9HYPO|nr:SIR2 family histone deacetylase-like protein [Emericellopsis cladophorae]KAI6779726.1 SIR2 family histone deacetylase-like protein [Emericellopsis cladophorae]
MAMRKPIMRIPYTDLLVPGPIVPASASTLPGAISALTRFFTTPPPGDLPNSTVVLTGAGLSVASGLADYRGVKGTYRVNKTYRPIYHHEFLSNHEARKRYWARSFLGWSSLHKAKPNGGHHAIRDLGDLGFVKDDQLARLNPRWALLLEEAMASGALNTEDPMEKRFRGLKTNPDGDVDLPDAPYTTFRYPPCPKCLHRPPLKEGGDKHLVKADREGAWELPSTAGILKPAVVMFGESIATQVKTAAEDAIDSAGKLLVLVNMGGVRGEDQFFKTLTEGQQGEEGVRVEQATDELLPALVSRLRREQHIHMSEAAGENLTTFKDMLS